MALPRTQDFEKLGAFYLGKRYDLDGGGLGEELVLYDAKDLTTHAVIIGMTGSGKTGLGIGLLEEAAIDRIPVIAIDPKGDLGNMMLSFPKLSPSDFAPWVNTRSASDEGLTSEQFAAAQASLWRDGLAKWGQDGARIQRLHDAVDIDIYTPGSSAGLPVSLLRSFDAPDAALRDDADLYRERIQATATSLLALLDVDADPLTSREHILLSTILAHAWDQGQSLDLGGLIGAVQQPPVTRIGVMDLDAFYPPKDRFALALRLNNLLAAPGFDVWMRGEPLSASTLLHTPSGKPRVSIMSIAHLSEPERMFFVSMLLAELIAWMRAQPGTSTLRAILYMDEIFGYMPPVANPPSKQLLLTLLKQARAYGVGLVLATQNPVDLDYKGLSNTGTWFVGRLQTERDKARLLAGLEGAAAEGDFDRGRMEEILAGLGKRRFLLHNVHEDHPVVFHTRWAMSYLPGPLTREQIARLMESRRDAADTSPAGDGAPTEMAADETLTSTPLLGPGVPQVYAPVAVRGGPDTGLVYHPRLVGAARVAYTSVRHKIDTAHELVLAAPLEDGPVPYDWQEAEPIGVSIDAFREHGEDDARFAEVPGAAASAKSYAAWQRAFIKWIRNERPLMLYRSASLKLTSAVGESEREFRIRLQEVASERRDLSVEKLRKKYAGKATKLEERLRRAEQAIEREQAQAKGRKLDAAVAFGTAVLGALLGRKKVSRTSTSKFGTAVRSAGRVAREQGDVERARENADSLRHQLLALEEECEREVEALDETFDAQAEELEEIRVRAKSTGIHVQLFGLGWMPFHGDATGRLTRAWSQDEP